MWYNEIMIEGEQGEAVIKSAETDTDSSQSRLKRADNQYRFEMTTEAATYGKGFKDRYTASRVGLFEGFSNVRGEDYRRLAAEGRILSDDRPQVKDEYMPSNEAAAAALEGFVPLIDSLYQRLAAMPEDEEREEVVFRMLGALFVGGVLIHPASDGNGQTFKMLVVNYLHDLLPAYRDRFLPIKYDQGEIEKEYSMMVGFMGGRLISEKDDLVAGKVPEIEPKDERDARVVQLAHMARGIRDKIIVGENLVETQERECRDMRSVVEEAAKLDTELFAEVLGRLKPPETRWFGLKKVASGDIPVPVVFLGRCVDYLVKQGYPLEQSEATVYSRTVNKLGRASHAVRRLMTTETGLQMISDYVISGRRDLANEGEDDRLLFGKMINAMDRQKDKFKTALEAKEEHRQRQERHIKSK